MRKKKPTPEEIAWCERMRTRICDFPEIAEDGRIWRLCVRNRIIFFYELVERLDELCKVEGAGKKTISVLCNVVEKYSLPKPGSF